MILLACLLASATGAGKNKHTKKEASASTRFIIPHFHSHSDNIAEFGASESSMEDTAASKKSGTGRATSSVASKSSNVGEMGEIGELSSGKKESEEEEETASKKSDFS